MENKNKKISINCEIYTKLAMTQCFWDRFSSPNSIQGRNWNKTISEQQVTEIISYIFSNFVNNSCVKILTIKPKTQHKL